MAPSQRLLTPGNRFWSIVVCAALLVFPVSGSAQEITGLQAAAAIEKALVDAIARSENSVVAIGIFRIGDQAGSAQDKFDRDGHPLLDAVPDAYATGVVIDRQGLILTCWHSLQDKHKTTRQYIRVAGRPVWWEVRVRAADPFSDLAVLEVLAPDRDTARLALPPITLGDAEALRKGQIVITLGNPYAIASDGEVSAGWGIVSNLRRKAPPRAGKPAPMRRPTMHHFGTLIQTDAKLNLGTSGGALLNLKGEMVGLTTSMAAIAGFEKSAGYAIAVDATFRRVVEKLKRGEEVEYGFLGVGPEDLMHAERVRGQTGVRISKVIPGSPASRKLRAGDLVTHINNRSVLQASELMLAIGRQPPEARVRFQGSRMSRNSRNQPLDETIQLTKNHVLGERVYSVPPKAWRGIQVDYPAAQRPLVFLDSIPAEGVIVTQVDSDSPAEASGLSAGARITHVEKVAVNTPEQFHRAVQQHAGAVRLRLAGSALDTPIVVNAP